MAEELAEVIVHGRPGIIPQALMRSQQNSPTAKVIYGLLTTFKDPFPGQRWLAARVPCSRPTVILRLRELELCGWLVRRKSTNRRAGITDRYDIYLSPLPMSKRAPWVQALGLSEEEIARLSQTALLNIIKSNGLTQTILPKTREVIDKRSNRQEKQKQTDTNVSGQARADDPPKQAKRTQEKPPQGREEFVEYLRAHPPQTRAEYNAAICGLARRLPWY